MQIKLKIPERISLINLLNEFKGNISGLNKIIKIIEQLEISEKEKKEIDLKLFPSGNGGLSFHWDKKKEKVKSIDLDGMQTGIIKQLFETKSRRNEINLGDKILLEVIEKLGIKIDELDIQEQKGGEKFAPV
jgi:hypothetical protein